MFLNKNMINSSTTLDYDNVNGVKLSLKVEKRQNSPNSRQFTITYKNIEKTSKFWPRLSLVLAIIFNILSFMYIRISLTAVLVIIIVLSFLVFFWVTHSVQSETLLVIPTVCMQSSVKYVYGREDNFISWSSIDDVIINEVIKMNRVLYFLTVLIKQNNPSSQESETVKLVPLFKYTKPRLVMLEKIYSELQTLLVDAQKETVMGSGDKG
ncbi:phosphatidylinositol N-acetylglucosaminyltransferase subunit H-like [Trichoplusia ni]|uniref:Phosphatidylinositol N-acetylglucosaminyltransferase subunit H-like n=1 Tax=Trichoplusia ni TaxID=7111 RepID=A0A7E5W4V3_TRINI|nr:phosphatidylinositol N-acetylglucosaminyltransferase subunit H-like [Trichoplusia ni]